MKTGLVYVLIFFVSGLWHQAARAQNVRDISEYPSPVAEPAVSVKVQISRVDHELLRADYPFMSHWTNEQIENWCSNHLNLIAKSQAGQSKANTPVDYQNFRPKAAGDRSAGEPYVSGVFRPDSYGRALVIEVYDPVTNKKYYFDGKGLGGRNPKPLPHATGLASFGETNREITMATMVDRALKHAGSQFSAVRTYFQFQYEFDMLEKTSANHTDISRAGSVFRQNHLRTEKIVAGEKDNLGGADPATSLAVEKILRRYGITSSGSDYHGISGYFDVTNVQITRDGLKLYDFGGYIVDNKFDKPVLEWDTLTDYLVRYPAEGSELKSRVDRGLKGAKALVLTAPGDANFVQPDPQLKLSFDFFGYGVTGNRSVRYDGPWIFSHNMDRDARARGLHMIPREWVESHAGHVAENLKHLGSHPSCRLFF